MSDTVSMNAIVDVNEADFAVEVEQSKVPVFVDFWSPGCGPCRALEPMIDRLAQVYGSQIKFVKVNFDDNQALLKRLGVDSLPTLLLFRDGQEIERTIGAQSKAHFSNLLDKYVTTPVTFPTATATVAARPFRAFYGDAALRDAVVARVRDHIQNDRILWYGNCGPIADVEKQSYSLMAAALESVDIQRYEGTLGIPAEVGRIAEVVHSYPMRGIDVDGEKEYHLRGASSAYELEWLQAIPLGADLTTLRPRFIRWYLTDLAADPCLQDFPQVREMIGRIAHLHGRQAEGDAPTPAQWKEVRTATGELLKRIEAEENKPFLHYALQAAEMLAWPTNELEDVLVSSMGTALYALYQVALPSIYTPEQWAERRVLYKAAEARHEASPDVTQEELDAFEEIRAFQEFMAECLPKDDDFLQETQYAYGVRLHHGLMQVLAETVKMKA